MLAIQFLLVQETGFLFSESTFQSIYFTVFGSVSLYWITHQFTVVVNTTTLSPFVSPFFYSWLIK